MHTIVMLNLEWHLMTVTHNHCPRKCRPHSRDGLMVIYRCSHVDFFVTPDAHPRKLNHFVLLRMQKNI